MFGIYMETLGNDLFILVHDGHSITIGIRYWGVGDLCLTTPTPVYAFAVIT